MENLKMKVNKLNEDFSSRFEIDESVELVEEVVTEEAPAEEEIIDEHLKNRWFESIEQNYLSAYLLVLHQKYATYNYLYKLAEDIDRSDERINRMTLIEFNSKYVFSIVSDEQNIQNIFCELHVVETVTFIH